MLVQAKVDVGRYIYFSTALPPNPSLPDRTIQEGPSNVSKMLAPLFLPDYPIYMRDNSEVRRAPSTRIIARARSVGSAIAKSQRHM